MLQAEVSVRDFCPSLELTGQSGGTGVFQQEQEVKPSWEFAVVGDPSTPLPAPAQLHPAPHHLPRSSWLARFPFRTRQALGRKTKPNPAAGLFTQTPGGLLDTDLGCEKSGGRGGAAEEPTHLGAAQPRGSSFTRWPERTLISFGDKT